MSDDFQYIPEDEEVDDTIRFMMNCSHDDLKESWIRISAEWNIESVVKLHKELCTSNRINELLTAFSHV